jgi:hypothetical protein
MSRAVVCISKVGLANQHAGSSSTSQWILCSVQFDPPSWMVITILSFLTREFCEEYLAHQFSVVLNSVLSLQLADAPMMKGPTGQ